MRIGRRKTTTLKTLKLLGLNLIRLVKQAWSLPQMISDALKLRQQRILLNALEAERLDRIRNPSKYLGK